MKTPFVSFFDDGSMAIEFIKDHCRFSIFIENNLEESSWVFSTARAGDFDQSFGKLPSEMIKCMKSFDEASEK